jgi:2-keto-4-pentenoate hydratase/2-oxohepta-3-ene-1,7-dioic acid hydratase in catechol pathway
MRIGRAICSDGQAAWIALGHDGLPLTYDPGTGTTGVALNITRLLPPCTPSKIVCLGLNYRDHAEEMGLAIPTEPILFLKPPSSIIGHGDAIAYPEQSARVDYEAELAVVIARRIRKISPDNALDSILGYTCLNDVTARDLQAKDGQWTRAKSFDTFAPLGPWIETAIADPHRLDIKLSVNGEVRQSSNTRHLIFSIPEIVAYISGIMTLEPGDVIATGTPSGIGPLNRGDRVCVEIQDIGVLENCVV